MGSGSSRGWTAEVSDALGQVRVADNVEQLRLRMEQLITRLADAERAVGLDPEQPLAAGAGRKADPDSVLAASAAVPGGAGRTEIEQISREVEHADRMLAELSELLEAQSRRIEQVESGRRDTPDANVRGGAEDRSAQTEDRGSGYDAARFASAAAPQPQPNPHKSGDIIDKYQRRLLDLEAKLCAVLDDRHVREEVAGLTGAVEAAVSERQEAGQGVAATQEEVVALQDFLSIMLDRIDEGFGGLRSRIDHLTGTFDAHLRGLTDRVGEMRTLLAEKDSRIAELEERLMLLVEGDAAPAHDGSDVPGRGSHGEDPRTGGSDRRGDGGGSEGELEKWPRRMGPPAFEAVVHGQDRQGLIPPLLKTGPAFAPIEARDAVSETRLQSAPESSMPAFELVSPEAEFTAAAALPPAVAAQTLPLAHGVDSDKPGQVSTVMTRSTSPSARDLLSGRGRIVDRGDVEIEPGATGARSAQTADVGHLVPGKARPTVMVVDDATDARTILSLYLSRTGFQVVTAASAEDCLAKLRHHAVDAIVLDASLPGADGGHVCRVLRSESDFESKRRTPVIIYTGYPDEYTRTLANQWKADDYVVKGGDMLALMSSLLRHTSGPAAVGLAKGNGA